MKRFTAGHKLKQKQVTSADFEDITAKAFKAASAYTGFLCRAVDLPF